MNNDTFSKLAPTTALSRLLWAIVIIIFVWPLTQKIFDFFDIGIELYGSYLIWFIALIIFWAILPHTVGKIFDS